jgi:tetratricopeptide (TPR) repeat protein
MRNLMNITKSNTILHRTFYQVLALTMAFCTMPLSAQAVQWEPLARTGQHEVAIDTGSVRLTSLSRLAVWLRFTPFGEQQRRQAAVDNGQKTYRLHLEYYEIDCSEQSAVLGLVDILGPAGKRLARKKGGGPSESIIPGSVLDMASRKVCPDLEENSVSADDEIEAPESDPLPEVPEEMQITEESQHLLVGAIQKTERDPKDLEAWRELGNAYFDADMPAKAITAYTRALSIKPDDTDILNDQGAMYRQTGDFTHALANFEKARQVDPYNLESIYNSGYVLAFDLNQIDRAIVMWRSYLKLDKTSETSRQVQSFIERYGISAGNNVRK